MRIKPPKKYLCFSTSFKCAFEPLIIIFLGRFQALISFQVRLRALSPSNAPSSLWSSFLGRFQALISFKCAFEPLIIIFRALSSPYLLSNAPPSLWTSFFRALSSPYLLLSAPLSPRIFSSTPLSPRFLSSAPSSPQPSFWVRLRALIFLFFFLLG